MGWTLDDPFRGAEAALEDLARRVVDDTAEAVLKDARRLAPVDTSALRESGYVANAQHSGAQAAKEAAQSVNSKVALSDPLVVEDFGEGIEQAWVDFLVVYAVFVANGYYAGATKRRWIPGRDFLGAALTRQRAAFHARAERELAIFQKK